MVDLIMSLLLGECVCHGQSSKSEENLRWYTVTRQLLSKNLINFLKAFDNVIRATNIYPNS